MEAEINIIQKETKLKGSSGSKAQSKWTPLWFLLPALVVIAGVIAYPLLYEVRLSFTDASFTNIVAGKEKLIGLRHYLDIFGSASAETGKWVWNWTFLKAMRNTFIWTFVNVFFHVTLGIFMGILLNRKLPGKPLLRVLLILPWAVPQYIVALTWRGMFNNPYGAISVVMNKLFGPEGPVANSFIMHSDFLAHKVQFLANIPWWSDPQWNFIAAIITNIWLGVPFMMMTTLGGLQSIPEELYEAADVDGVSAWQKIRHITLPLLKPIMLPATVLGTIWTFNMINIIYIMQGGMASEEGDILVSLVYKRAFYWGNYGSAAALSIVIFLILLAMSTIITKSQRSKEY